MSSDRNPLPREVGRAPLEPDEPVSCHTCLREVPRSVALATEGSDYVFYFCGSGCFARWGAPSPRDRSPANPT
ncbi:MAG: DUF3330 domain-containing protein [Betaproteobacteria bacterium]|nr:DUF3330 domain-containing protein [Betaproteobacteria bacterium]